MKKKAISSLLGGTDIREPIKISGRNLYLKLLSVYEALLCDSMSRKLADELVKDGAEKKIAVPIAENACLAYMCLYNRRNRRVFENSSDVVNTLTSEELLKIAEEYVKVKDSFLSFNNLSPKSVLELKKNSTIQNRELYGEC